MLKFKIILKAQWAVRIPHTLCLLLKQYFMPDTYTKHVVLILNANSCSSALLLGSNRPASTGNVVAID